MTMLRYAVVQCDKEWILVGASRRMGHFLERQDALVTGARLAMQAMQSGYQVELLVQQGAAELVRDDPANIYSASDRWADSQAPLSA